MLPPRCVQFACLRRPGRCVCTCTCRSVCVGRGRNWYRGQRGEGKGWGFNCQQCSFNVYLMLQFVFTIRSLCGWSSGVFLSLQTSQHTCIYTCTLLVKLMGGSVRTLRGLRPTQKLQGCCTPVQGQSQGVPPSQWPTPTLRADSAWTQWTAMQWYWRTHCAHLLHTTVFCSCGWGEPDQASQSLTCDCVRPECLPENFVLMCELNDITRAYNYGSKVICRSCQCCVKSWELGHLSRPG